MISGGFPTPMRKRSLARPLAEQERLPPDLEARIVALESAAPRSDFDRSSWFWMILLGIAVPAILLFVGWRA
jgi:hypothetical protein